MDIDKRKKLKYKNKLWNVKVSTYKNKRICLILESKKDSIEITIDLNDAYLDNGRIFLDPAVKDNGILNVLRKSRIIKSITGMIYYDYLSVPVALLNMGILRSYDYNGVMEHFETINKEEDI